MRVCVKLCTFSACVKVLFINHVVRSPSCGAAAMGLGVISSAGGAEESKGCPQKELSEEFPR